jgi:ABC-2 type transport system permease protein
MSRGGVGFVGAAARVFELSWPSLLWGRRARWLTPLLAWPALVPLLGRLAGARAAAWNDVAAGFYLDTLLPLVALFQASRLIREEVENRTIVYLLARPAPRPSILLGRFAAYLAASLIVVWPALVLGFFLSGGSGTDELVRVLGAAAAALVAYGALYTLAGLVLAKPMVVGLGFLFGWELLTHLPGTLPRLTITAHLRTLAGVNALPDLTLPLAVAELGALTVACLAAAVILFKHGEYVPEP